MSLHTASQKYSSFHWRPESLFSARHSTVTISPNTGSRDEPLSTTPLHGELHLHTFPRLANGEKSQSSSIGPAIVELRAMTQTSKAWKIPTHTSRSWRPSFKLNFFNFDAPSSRTLSSPSLFPSSMPRPETVKSGAPLIPVGFAVFNRRATCNCKQRRVWPGASGQQLGRFRRNFLFFFFWYFQKSYTHGQRETKKTITVAKYSNVWPCVCILCVSRRRLPTCFVAPQVPEICSRSSFKSLIPGSSKSRCSTKQTKPFLSKIQPYYNSTLNI